jgi:acyl-CoA synthetase (AMP-forming)/AMP-acid ligase II
MANFAAELVTRAGNARLIDGRSGQHLSAADIPVAAGWWCARADPGDRVLVGCDQTPVSALAVLGAIYAGLVPLPVDGSTFKREGDDLVARIDATARWAATTAMGHTADGTGEAILGGPAAAPPARQDCDLAALMRTSGSTGRPRLVRVSHGNLMANTRGIASTQQLAASDRACLVLPVSYCFGASVVYSHLFVGADVVFDSRFMFPDKVLRGMAEHGCTTFAGVPTNYKILDRRSSLGTIPLPSLRRFLQAGGPLDEGTIRRIRQACPSPDFLVMYGQTEATARITTRAEGAPAGVGHPLPGLQLRIGEQGEVLVRGPSICSGYWDDAEVTAARFVDGWLHTGDMGQLDTSGALSITGRLARFAKVRGRRVSLAEVEQLAVRVSGVADVAVAAVPHVEAGEALALWVVADAGVTAEVAESVREALPVEWTIAKVAVVAALPQTDSGKVDHAALVAG